jgi:hypothetical protein
MELILRSNAFQQWIVQVLTVFFLIGGFVGVAVGVGLIVNSVRTQRVFDTLNRWVSMRPVARPLEIPRDTTQAVQKHRRWLAVVFMAGGAFATFVLITKYDANAARDLLNLKTVHPALALSIVDGARWILIVGNLAAIVVGMLLAFFPAKLAAIEVRGSSWFSERKHTRGADKQHLSLDNWVAAQPRRAGILITAGSLLMMGAIAFMLLGSR